jgi:formyltetrahydrofolate deformylase
MSVSNVVLVLRCPDKPGIVHDVSRAIVDAQGNILESAQFFDPSTDQFSMRVCFSVAGDPTLDSLREHFSEAGMGERFQMNWSLHDSSVPSRVLILVSKFDHCLADLLYRQGIGDLPITISAVVSNHRDVYQRVASHDVPFYHLPVTPETKSSQEARMREIIQEYDVDFVVLARYMQVLSKPFCDDFAGRIINIHHSFLPGFKGARPYHQAYDRGVKLIGATAHYVTGDLDEGPIIEQDVSRVTHAQSPDQLIALGREIEQRVLGRAVKYQAEHRVVLNGAKTVVFS